MIRQRQLRGRPGIRRPFRGRKASGRFFRPAARGDHALFDLPGYIAARLAAAGIGRVEDLGLCTYADAERFFSYRRSTHRDEADYGRHLNAIVLGN